jgi:hypothetical protein
MTHTSISSIADQLEIPDQGTFSRMIFKDHRLRLVGFAFDKDQEPNGGQSSTDLVARFTLNLGRQGKS